MIAFAKEDTDESAYPYDHLIDETGRITTDEIDDEAVYDLYGALCWDIREKLLDTLGPEAKARFEAWLESDTSNQCNYRWRHVTDFAKIHPQNALNLADFERKILGQLVKMRRVEGPAVFEIGRLLHEAQQVIRISRESTFRKWVEQTFDFSHQTAYKRLRVFRRFERYDCKPELQRIDATALYLLAEDGTPEEAIVEALELAKLGQTVCTTRAKHIAAKYQEKVVAEKPTPEMAIAAPIVDSIDGVDLMPRVNDQLDPEEWRELDKDFTSKLKGYSPQQLVAVISQLYLQLPIDYRERYIEWAAKSKMEPVREPIRDPWSPEEDSDDDYDDDWGDEHHPSVQNIPKRPKTAGRSRKKRRPRRLLDICPDAYGSSDSESESEPIESAPTSSTTPA